MWQARLRANYDGFAEWETYALMYGLHTRLGFETPQEAWDANPMTRGSTDPSDYGLADATCEVCSLDLGDFTAGFVCDECSALYCNLHVDDEMRRTNICPECR